MQHSRSCRETRQDGTRSCRGNGVLRRPRCAWHAAATHAQSRQAVLLHAFARRVLPPCHAAGSNQAAAAAAGRALPAEGQRLRVAVDIDEVLGRFVLALNGFIKSRYGMEYSVGDYTVYEFAKVWGCSQDESNRIVHSFFRSPEFNDGIPVLPDALATLQRLGAWCDLMVVTSRQHAIQDATLDWIDGHYPGIFQEVYFGNHFALEGASRSKSDICRSIGAHVLIDDNVGYARDCAGSGVRVLLFDWEGSYPWSKLGPGPQPDNIEVVTSWQQVEAALLAMAPAAASRR